MTLDEINTEDFLFNPKTKRFVENMTKYKVFDIPTSHLKQKNALTYVSVLYDKNSELRKLESDLWIRKCKAALVANFRLMDDNKFGSSVEEMMRGDIYYINKAILAYVALQFDSEFQAYIKYEEELYNYYGKPLDKNSFDLIEKIRGAMIALRDQMFGGDDSRKLRKAINALARVSNDELMPEDVVKKYGIDGLHDWGQYGKRYRVEKLKFIGNVEPK